MPSRHAEELRRRQRFAFGENWTKFLAVVDERRVEQATQTLRQMLARHDMPGLRFLDIGSGSGLFSLAAHRLGAQVHSFDYDPQSVACTREMKRRYARPQPDDWTIAEGSVLDTEYLASLGEFDIVYSWGVLHHTGSMWTAIRNASERVRQGGCLWIALYNDQGARSRSWHRIKRLYNRLPGPLKPLLLPPALAAMVAEKVARDGCGRRVLTEAASYQQRNRGMSYWRDVVDWVGGFPFEVATPEAVFDFMSALEFRLDKLRTRCSHGCNEFVWRREGSCRRDHCAN